MTADVMTLFAEGRLPGAVALKLGQKTVGPEPCEDLMVDAGGCDLLKVRPIEFAAAP